MPMVTKIYIIAVRIIVAVKQGFNLERNWIELIG
jgi:hypothetical protein